MFELLFLAGFTLHNIEEGLWLPRWSAHAAKFHPPVTHREFHFAVLVVTVLGYVLTFLFLAWGNNAVIKYSYYGFVLMMIFNVFFPHCAATVVLKRYAPGMITGLFLNLPIGMYILHRAVDSGDSLYYILLGASAVGAATLAALKPLFRLGRKLLDDY